MQLSQDILDYLRKQKADNDSENSEPESIQQPAPDSSSNVSNILPMLRQMNGGSTDNSLLQRFAGTNPVMPDRSIQEVEDNREEAPEESTKEEQEPIEDVEKEEKPEEETEEKATPESSKEEQKTSEIKPKKGATLDFTGTRAGSPEELKALQDYQRKAQLATALGQAADIAGSGLARIKATPEAFTAPSQMAALAGQQYLEKQQQEKNDPNSALSKGFKSYLEQHGINIKGSITAADAEVLLPTVFKEFEMNLQREAQKQNKELQYATLAQQKQSDRDLKSAIVNSQIQSRESQSANKLEQQNALLQQKQGQQADKDQLKAQKDVLDQLQRLKSRGSVKGAFDNEYSADKALALINQYPDLNKMPKAQQTLLLEEISKIAKGGVSTEGELKNLLPNTFVGKLESLAGQVLNSPQPAQAGAFIQEMLPYLQELKNTSQKYIGRNVNDVLEGNRERISQDKYNEFKDQYSDYLNKFKESKAQKSPQSLAKPTPAPGSIVNVKGKMYKVGDDGDSLTPVQ